MAQPPRSFDFVYLEFGDTHRQDALALLSRLAAKIPATRRRLVVIDNAGAPSLLQRLAPFDEVVVLEGDNSSREFSGWDVGAAWLKRDDSTAATGYIFSNDTIARHRGFGMGRKRCFAGALAHLPTYSIPVVCGEIDGLPAQVAMPWGTHGLYASTYLFGMNRLAFESLTPFCALSERIDAMLAPSWPTDSLCTDAMPTPYAQHIAHWLHRSGGWYGAEPLSERNFVSMRAKAKMILLEQSMGARLAPLGGKLVSIYQGDGVFARVVGDLANRYERQWRIPTRMQRLRQMISK